MSEARHGLVCEVVTRRVAPFEYKGELRDTVFIGRCCYYSNGVCLWFQSAGIHRLIYEDALEDAQQCARDLGITRVFNERTSYGTD